MRADELLARLDGVRRTARGWVSRCPAHDDRRPSLTITAGERAWLVHCWAGCTLDAICAALDLPVSALFYDDAPARDRRGRPAPRPLTPREWLAAAELGLWRGAITREFRALRVLDAARGCDVSAWTEEDRDRAMAAVCRADDDLRVAGHLHDLAADWRAHLLTLDRAGRAAA